MLLTRHINYKVTRLHLAELGPQPSGGVVFEAFNLLHNHYLDPRPAPKTGGVFVDELTVATGLKCLYVQEKSEDLEAKESKESKNL